MVNQAPRILSGRYEVGELIGRGGMAEVHIGHDSRLGRTVAIKILRSDLARDPSFQVRFRREAQAAASLNHPAIVAVYDTGEDTVTEPGGAVSHVPFIVMEYVEGHTVRDVLRDGNAVPIEEALEITAGILSALEYSHNAGIVHRDIKPANVMLTPTGAVKVMDFGIARALADSAATMTQTQAVIGTAQYLSPEQARGDQVDTRSDLYSTGCLLYELLTGRPPFTGDSPVAVAYQHVRELPKPPSTIAPDVPSFLDAITLKALEKDREDRYATAAEFRAAIEAAARGEAVDVTRVNRVVPAAVPTPAETPATAVIPQQPVQPPVEAVAAVPAWQNQTPVQELLPDTEEEQDSGKKRLLWILLSVALVAALAIAAFVILNGEKREEPATMPKLTGLTVEEVKDALVAAKFTAAPDIRYEASIDIDKGYFVRADPGQGDVVPANTVVKVWFSQGPSDTVVPDVKGKTEQEATEILTKANLKVNPSRVQDHSPDVEKGKVTSTEPATGESVAEGTSITLHVSDGFVDVPDLTEFTLDEAKETLDKLKLEFEKAEEKTNDYPENSIIRQSQGPGAVTQKSKITVTVAIPAPVVFDDVRGASWPDVENYLRGLKLKPESINEWDDTIPAGDVIRTSPGPDTELELHSQVTVYVSKGPEPQPEPEPTETEEPPATEEPPPAQD